MNMEKIIKALESLIAETSKCANEKYVEACGLFCSARMIMVSDLAHSKNNECNESCKHYAPPYMYCVLKDALALIKEQQAEIERLQKYDTDVAFKHYNDGVSDTVKKMQERLRFEIINKPSEFSADQGTVDFLNGSAHRQLEVLEIVDQIAKEILESK